MFKTRTGKILIGFSLVVSLLMALAPGLSAQGPMEPTRVRPTVDPGGGGGGGGGGGNQQASIRTSDDSAANTNCAALYGQAIHWGVGDLGNVNLSLHDGGWGMEQMTSGDGRYNFGALGVGSGILTVNSGQSELKPMVDHAAIRLSCDFAIQANIGVYGGDQRPTPPGQLSMKASAKTVSPGQIMTIILTVKNTLPNPISQVIVTDLFPKGLTVEDVKTSRGQVELLNGELLTVIVGSVPQDGQEEITIWVSVDDDLVDGMMLSNTATLFYAESAADQASLTLNIGRSETIAEATDSPDQAVAEADSKPTADGQDDDPPGVLPVTGIGVTLSLPLALLAIIGLFAKGFVSARNKHR